MEDYKLPDEKEKYLVLNLISTFKNYDREESGKKPNTVRFGFSKMSKWKQKRIMEATHLRLRRGYTSTSFIRKVTDLTIYNDAAILSWNPNDTKIEYYVVG